jgi:hypothetical protein
MIISARIARPNDNICPNKGPDNIPEYKPNGNQKFGPNLGDEFGNNSGRLFLFGGFVQGL